MMALLLALSAMSAPADCRMAAMPIEAGAVVDADNTTPGACDAAPRARRLRYDARAGVVRARVALFAGEPLGRMLLAPRPRALVGDRIAITARLGVVTVSRTAVALQPAHAGSAFFVRGEDGKIFAAPAIAGKAR